ncbi:MAG TPA: redoxin family protein [Polyangiaceae bacterium]|nr:redoxin family protein [Polyangiaceae bacterium]
MDVTRAALLALVLAACAPARSPSSMSSIPNRSLPGGDGRPHALVAPEAKLTVIEFFSAHCPCQAAHDARLRDLVKSYAPRGVAFLALDSEAGNGIERARAEAQRRDYVHPILVDAGGAMARALAADYATYTLVVDRDGHVVYVGGIDSDKNHLTDDAVPYLRDALDDALADRPLRRPDGKTLGCALMLE